MASHQGLSERRAHPTRAIRIPVPNDVFVPTAQAGACPLGTIEAQVLDRIDGRTPISEIAVVLELSVRETAMVVARLVELGATEKRWTNDG